MLIQLAASDLIRTKILTQDIHVQTALTNIFELIVLRILPSSAVFYLTMQHLWEEEGQVSIYVHGDSNINSPIGVS